MTVAGDSSRSRIVLGGKFGWEDESLSAAKLDRFAQHHGGLVETAYSYATGRSKEVVGAWLRSHPGDLGVITKVGHDLTGADVALTPETVLDQTRLCLQALEVETVDVLLLHCDDPQRSVGELADTLQEVCRAGLARQIGVSNWAAARLQALAETIGDTDLPLVASYHYSLAVPDPQLLAPFGLSATPEILQVVDVHGMDLLAWSGTAGGYFSRADVPARESDPFDGPVSRARRERVRTLAHELELPSSVVALAWSLARPRTWTSVGPRDPAGVDEFFTACDAVLSEEQLAWLVAA